MTNAIAPVWGARATGSKLSSRPSRSGSRRRKSAPPEDWAALSPGAPACLLAPASPSLCAAAALPQRPAPSLQLRVLSSRSAARGSSTSAPSSAAMIKAPSGGSVSTSSCSTPFSPPAMAGSGGGGRKRLSWWDDYEDRKSRGAYTPLTASVPSSPGGTKMPDFDGNDDCYLDDWKDLSMGIMDDADDEGDDSTRHNRKSSGFEEMTIVEDGVAVRDLFFSSPRSSFHDDVGSGGGEGGSRRSSVAFPYGHRRSSSAGSRRLFLLQLDRQRQEVVRGRRMKLALVGGGLGLFMLMCILYALSWMSG